MEPNKLATYLKALNVRNIHKFYSEENFPSIHNEDHYDYLMFPSSKDQEFKSATALYSRKVFVGGLPPDIYENEIVETFYRFGKVSVSWPHKSTDSCFPPKGYAFLVFEHEQSVKKLIRMCTISENKFYLEISSQTMKNKPVQIRPWYINDAHYISDKSAVLDPRKTVFIGGIPRTVTAYELAMVLHRLYDNVSYAGIDLDPEFNYPKGAGRVAFETYNSYVAAISDRFVHLKVDENYKRIEIKPFILDNQLCDECKGQFSNGEYAQFFCTNIKCLEYYCGYCWNLIHSHPSLQYHVPYIKDYM